MLKVSYKGIPMNLFFVRMTKRSKWKLFLTTDMSLSFIKAFEIYKIRWSIEVFFKDCKQYLDLGKNQSTDFDAQIADATLVCIRYIMFSLYKRVHAYKSIGLLFFNNKKDFMVRHIGFRVAQFFLALLQFIVEQLDLEFDIMAKMEQAIADQQYGAKLLAVFSTLEHQGGKN